jgi:hypothetical protein
MKKGGERYMKKAVISAGAALAGLMGMVVPVFASPIDIAEDAFVCPVITTDAVLNSPKGAAIGEGHYTIGGPSVVVPEDATNADGEGTPPGPHSQPGDPDYTAIWSGN